MTAHVAKPPMKSAVLFGWEDRNGLVPVYFKSQMSSDFLQDLICTCKGKSVCMKGCICFEQSLSCTETFALAKLATYATMKIPT
jgi:hypothetical protein